MNHDHTAKVLANLLGELSTEIDLHYEDNELHGCRDTFEVMRSAATELETMGARIPDEYQHVLGRYRANTKSERGAT